MDSRSRFAELDPSLQISFFHRLRTVRWIYLIDAVQETVGTMQNPAPKAKKRGFLEFWTILWVDTQKAVVEALSPTTSRAFNLDRILDVTSAEHTSFVREIRSRIGIRDV